MEELQTPSLATKIGTVLILAILFIGGVLLTHFYGNSSAPEPPAIETVIPVAPTVERVDTTLEIKIKR